MHYEQDQSKTLRRSQESRERLITCDLHLGHCHLRLQYTNRLQWNPKNMSEMHFSTLALPEEINTMGYVTLILHITYADHDNTHMGTYQCGNYVFRRSRCAPEAPR